MSVLRKNTDNQYSFVCSDNGIGMSVVKGFTELMGGKLSVESKEGDGSTFTVDIPFSTAS